MLRPSRFELQYGAFFDAPSPDLPEALIHYCQDTCRAIELLEGQKIIFDPVKADKAESGDTHYFYFIRSRLANEFIHLNAEFAKRFDRARCILLAAKIVEYLVLVDNYIITIPIFLARGIHECLQAQNIVKEWSGIEDLFMWVLWVAACVPQIDDKLRTEFIFLAKEADIKYNTTASSTKWNAKDTQCHRARQFVWAAALDEKLCNLWEEEARQQCQVINRETGQGKRESLHV